jgi:twitching motility protein PilI
MNAFAQAGSALSMQTPTQALSTGFTVLREQDAVNGLKTGLSANTLTNLRQGLQIGELNLMIRYQDGSELAELPSVYRLPHTPSWFRGMTNLHGALIPVFSLADYLGVASHAPSAQRLGHTAHKQMMLVLGSGIHAAGVLIDGLPRRLRFTEQDRADEVPVPQRLQAHVSASYWLEGQLWMDFRTDDLFDRFEADLRQEP